MYDGMQVMPQQMQQLVGSPALLLQDEECQAMGWHPIATAPVGDDIGLSVIEDGEVHALVFACRRTPEAWLNSATGQTVPVRPTHWRHWRANS
jgi:hypothetical protein